MNKKIANIVTILSIIMIFVYFGYRYYTYYYPINGTGATPSEIDESEIREGIAINNLIKSLPIQLNSFAIETYDYSKGKFRVILNEKLNTTSEIFSDWLSTSEYRAIPIKMFDIRFSK